MLMYINKGLQDKEKHHTLLHSMLMCTTSALFLGKCREQSVENKVKKESPDLFVVFVYVVSFNVLRGEILKMAKNRKMPPQNIEGKFNQILPDRVASCNLARLASTLKLPMPRVLAQIVLAHLFAL